MEYAALMRELGSVLGIDLAFSDAGTCSIFFDESEVMFEINENRLFIMADLGASEGRVDAAWRLLRAGNLGLETGFGCIGNDEERGQFTLCRVLEGELAYPDFEKLLTLFVGAVRYWKRWLSLPAPQQPGAEKTPAGYGAFSLRV